MFKLLFELVRKDLRIFIADRRSVIISFLVPTVLAVFIGYITASMGQSSSPQKISLLVVDQDHSAFSKALLEKLKAGSSFDVKESDEANAKSKVSKGDIPVALVIPQGFGAHAANPLTKKTAPPEYRLLSDPTRTMQSGLTQGALMRATMQVLPKLVYGLPGSSDDDQMPFSIKQEVQASGQSSNSSATSHAFAGMGMQGLLFWAVESAMTILRERKMGIWKRLRASPVSPSMFIVGKAISSTIRALATLAVVFGVGMSIFHFQIKPTLGCYVGFGLIALAASIMTACFGLLVAALGRNEQQSRGLSIFAVLGMCMLGGAWIPMDFLPNFMQNVGKAIPIFWAINGLDQMIWREGGLVQALEGVVVLLGFSVVFAAIAVKRIRFEPEAG